MRPHTSSKSLNKFILIGLFLGVILVSLGWSYLAQKQKILQIPLEKALYISDWNITKIYGPGTPQQASIVEKLKSTGTNDLFETNNLFNSYILYRMGADPGDSKEGLLMLGFDPKNPKTALQLKSTSIQ